MTSEIVTSYCKIIQTEAVTFLVLRISISSQTFRSEVVLQNSTEHVSFSHLAMH